MTRCTNHTKCKECTITEEKASTGGENKFNLGVSWAQAYDNRF